MNLTDKQLKLFGLCFGCPEIKPLNDCLLEKYRNEKAIDKMKLVEALSTDEVNYLIESHQSCLKKRVQERLLLSTA